MKCPKCGRETYSKKWGSCTACGYGEKEKAPAVTQNVTKPEEVTESVTPVLEEAEPITQAVTPGRYLQQPPPGTKWVLRKKPEPGEQCPLCERMVPLTNAQRQAAYRGRKA